MDSQEKALIERGEEIVERAKTKSRQPHFSDNGAETWDYLYQSVYTWLKHSLDEIVEQPYVPNSMARDRWLRSFWKLEPHWAGVVNNCVLVDSSRPWTLTGGKNQVRRWANVLYSANQGKGWRHYFKQASLSYRVTDMGSVTELGFPFRNGPVTAIYHVDSARCKWTGKNRWPLRYYPTGSRAKIQDWRPEWFFNVTSMPSDDEQFRDLGYCQTSRAFQLIKLLYGVLMHDQESVGSKMMKGLLLLSGIEEAQFKTAMESREAQQKEQGYEYYGGVFVLANSTTSVTGQLIGLSQLPENFDRETFISQLMFGYSLVAGYDPREFWPVSSGALGTARETEQQHKKASTKGTLEFPHAWKDRFQAILPPTILFEFEDRDTDAETMEAGMAQVWSDVVRTLYDNPGPEQKGLLTPEQALGMLVEHGVIPPEFTAAQEAVVLSDTYTHKRTVEQLRETSQVRQAIERFGKREPIVQIRWTPFGTSERTIYEGAGN